MIFDKCFLLSGLKLIVLLELNSPVSDPSVFTFNVLSEMHYIQRSRICDYIGNCSYLLPMPAVAVVFYTVLHVIGE